MSEAVTDPDFELRRGPGFNLLVQPAFFPLVISSIFTQNKGGGPPGPSPRSATARAISTKLCLLHNAVYEMTCNNCNQHYIKSTTHGVRECLNSDNSAVKIPQIYAYSNLFTNTYETTSLPSTPEINAVNLRIFYSLIASAACIFRDSFLTWKIFKTSQDVMVDPISLHHSFTYR